jgi:hypothetical protein
MDQTLAIFAVALETKEKSLALTPGVNRPGCRACSASETTETWLIFYFAESQQCSNSMIQYQA